MFAWTVTSKMAKMITENSFRAFTFISHLFLAKSKQKMQKARLNDCVQVHFFCCFCEVTRRTTLMSSTLWKPHFTFPLPFFPFSLPKMLVLWRKKDLQQVVPNFEMWFINDMTTLRFASKKKTPFPTLKGKYQKKKTLQFCENAKKFNMHNMNCIWKYFQTKWFQLHCIFWLTRECSHIQPSVTSNFICCIFIHEEKKMVGIESCMTMIPIFRRQFIAWKTWPFIEKTQCPSMRNTNRFSSIGNWEKLFWKSQKRYWGISKSNPWCCFHFCFYYMYLRLEKCIWIQRKKR